MNKKIYILSLCLLCSWSAMAETYSFGYVSLGAGYTSVAQDVQNAQLQGSYALLGGAGYEFRHNSFWLSVGAQYLREQSSLKADEFYTPKYEGKDDMGDDVLFQYAINQSDQHKWNTIDVPLLLGYYYSGFYIGAGAKVGFSFQSTIDTKGTYELIGHYDGYTLRNVNYYTTYPCQSTYSFDMRPQVALIGEVGYDLLSSMMNNQRICHLLKLGFYFEYGLTSIRSKESLAPVDFTRQGVVDFQHNDARAVTVNPYLLTTAQNKFSPFMVGVKLTYMIGGNRNSSGTWHRGCQCYNND